MPKDAHETLPGTQFLFAQSAAQITDDDEVVRSSTLAKLAAAHSETPRRAGKTGAGKKSVRFTDEAIREPKFRRVPTGRIHRYEALERVELMEVSTPELDDVVRLEDDFGREGTSEA